MIKFIKYLISFLISIPIILIVAYPIEPGSYFILSPINIGYNTKEANKGSIEAFGKLENYYKYGLQDYDKLINFYYKYEDKKEFQKEICRRLPSYLCRRNLDNDKQEVLRVLNKCVKNGEIESLSKLADLHKNEICLKRDLNKAKHYRKERFCKNYKDDSEYIYFLISFFNTEEYQKIIHSINLFQKPLDGNNNNQSLLSALRKELKILSPEEMDYINTNYIDILKEHCKQKDHNLSIVDYDKE